MRPRFLDALTTGRICSHLFTFFVFVPLIAAIASILAIITLAQYGLNRLGEHLSRRRRAR